MIVAALTVMLQQIGGGWESFHSLDWVGAQNGFAVLGDWNGDGLDDLLVGKSGWPAAGQGAAVILSGADGAELLRVVRADPSFGAAVAALGDLDSDGIPDFAVGAPDANANGLNRSGYVEVLSGAGGTPLYVRTGFVSAGRFGAVITAVVPAVGIGSADLLVSAPDIAPNGSGGLGVAYLYGGVSGALRFHVDGPDASSSSGWNTASLGAYGGQGSSAFAIGTPRAYVNGVPNVGMVRVYSASTGARIAELTQTATVFGSAVCRIPDFDGDFRDDVAISDGTWNPQPRVHIYSAARGLLSTILGPQYTAFGAALLGADFDHDGAPELAIGIPSHSPPGMSSTGGVAVHRVPDGARLALVEGEVQGAGLGRSLHLGIADRSGGEGPDLVAVAYSVYGAYTTQLAQFAAFHDYLHADVAAVSGRFGGRVAFRVEFPADDAGLPYLFLASAAGAGSTNFGGVQVPLERDWIYQRMILQPPDVLRGARGRLDAAGDADALLDLPPGAALPWVGRTILFAAVSVDGWLARRSSIAVPVLILP